MAPIDRAEREALRQQRKRGAGTTSAATDFNFAFNFAPAAANQSLAPPPRTQRTPTPRQQTPRVASSAKQHRSTSVHRSSSVRRHATPKASAVTPQLGKRKRGSQDAQDMEDDGEPDELSPDQNNATHSIERPRQIVGTVSPIQEEVDEEPDELSMVLDSTLPAKTPTPSNSTWEKAPSTKGTKTVSIRSRLPARRSQSTEASPETPSVLPRKGPRISSDPSNVPETPRIAPIEEEEEEEDELTPAPASITPRVVGKQSIVDVVPQEDEIDELSSPVQPGNTVTAPTPVVPEKRIPPPSEEQPSKPVAAPPAKRGRGRPTRIVVDEEDEVQSTPAATKPRRQKAGVDVQQPVDAEVSADELSPEAERTRKRPAKQKQPTQSTARREEPIQISSAGEVSADEEPEQEDEPTIRVLPIAKEKPVKRANNQMPRKRTKFSGPRQVISVMRSKGSTVKGVTVADTTRTALEENIDRQVQRMATKMESAEDSSRRKKLRRHVNLAIAFKEGLLSKLMDLQDANDTLSASFKKRKLLRKDNMERRKEILTIQKSQYEVALEADEVGDVYRAEREKAEAKRKLNDDMFEIEEAIRSGRERARREGREDEGPEQPLSMLLETVGSKVGYVGGGLLASLGHFNEGLERAAGWLEGRA